MNNNFKKIKIDKVCDVNLHSYSLSDNWDYINYLDISNITENIINKIQYLSFKNDNIPTRARRKVAYNDILFSTVRPNHRHYGILKTILPNMLVSTGFSVITPRPSLVNSDYLYYFLTQNHVIDSLQAISEQSVSTYPTIKPVDIKNLDIILPPISVQENVGSILRALDDLIILNEQINRHLASPRSAMDSWPDIKYGNNVFRSSTRQLDSLEILSPSLHIGAIIEIKSSKTLFVGTTI
jgi:type I restriction enzyme S subunit